MPDYTHDDQHVRIPQRIQLSRKGGFSLQERSKAINGLSAKSCARPHKWGNPIKLCSDGIICIDAAYRRSVLDRWVVLKGGDINDVTTTFEQIVTTETIMLNRDLEYWRQHFLKLDWSELFDKNLACWCGLENPCHVNVLLNVARNKKAKADAESYDIVRLYDQMKKRARKML